MPELTPEQQADSTARLDQFKEEITALSQKLSVDFITYPQFVPNEHGGFEIQVITNFLDTKYRPVPSLMSDQIIEK